MLNLKFYGTRGSNPLSGEEYIQYGEATTCIGIHNESTYLMVDCGSGASNALNDLKDVDTLHLFISHLHLDHISAFPVLVSAFCNKVIHVYGKTREGISIEEGLRKLMSNPLWPITFDENNIIFHEIGDDFNIDGINVKTMDSNHPGGCTLYRFEDKDNSVVCAFDFNHGNGYSDKLIEFIDKADILIYDGMYTEDEYKIKSDWGHSTANEGIRISKLCGIKELYITHFGAYSDDYLSSLEESLRKEFPSLRFARAGRHKDKFKKVLEIGASLTSSKDANAVLENIMRGAMDISGADGGTLYLLDNNELKFKIMITKSKNFYRGLNGEEVDMPPVKLSIKNVCAAAVLEKKTINVEDVYHNDDYDFSGPRKYDQLNKYRTKSVLVIPMVNDHGEIIGVLQLLNATDEMGKVVSFEKEDVEIIEALTSQAAIIVTNSNYAKQISELLFGFVKVISKGIDEITPYNANHTRNMVKYAEKFFDYQDTIDSPYKVNDDERKEILISIWLHDIGKLITPLEVMNKNTRLGNKLDEIKHRYEKIALLIELDEARSSISNKEYLNKIEELNKALEDIERLNNAGYLSEDDIKRINDIYHMSYKDNKNNEYKYLEDNEYKNMMIRKGTLSDEEREIMQRHVVMTSQMLEGLDFPRGFTNVPFYAGAHHEFLNGKGYPNHLVAKDLPWQARLITIIDIFEALTANDRPYKKPMPAEKAFTILDDMVKDGQLDNDLLEAFKKSKAWE